METLFRIFKICAEPYLGLKQWSLNIINVQVLN